MAILTLNNVRKDFGETAIIRGVSLDIEEGEKHAIIGPNGASAGSITFKKSEIQDKAPYEISRLGLARSFQVTNIFQRMNVFENIRCALFWSKGYRYSFWHLLGRQKELNEQAMHVLEQIGLTDKALFPSGELAYAQQRALELGIAIASGAELIMLDEPVAGMSHSEAKAAVRLIRKITEGKTLIMVEHDMNIVFDVADRISVLVYGEVIATDTPEKIRSNSSVQEAYLGEVATSA